MSDAGFEAVAKQSWQSFSTMKRFVSEATRLENASWRVWFMQRRHGSLPPSPPALGGPRRSYDGGDAQDAEAGDPYANARCVYCELHHASLSCNGCCHDAYCVSCFKLIHKKGNLATHTAVKIRHGKAVSPIIGDSVWLCMADVVGVMLNATAEPQRVRARGREPAQQLRGHGRER